MDVTIETEDKITIARPAGRLDSNTAGELESALQTILEKGSARVILDFADLSYISSAGLRIVLMTAKKTKALGGGLALCNLGDPIRFCWWWD